MKKPAAVTLGIELAIVTDIVGISHFRSVVGIGAVL